MTSTETDWMNRIDRERLIGAAHVLVVFLIVAAVPVAVYFNPGVVGGDDRYRSGHEAVIVADIDPDEIQGGTQIAYVADGERHRGQVVSVDRTDTGERQYRVAPDDRQVRTDQVVGRVVVSIPWYGAAARTLWQYSGSSLPILLVAYVGLVAVELWTAIRVVLAREPWRDGRVSAALEAVDDYAATAELPAVSDVLDRRHVGHLLIVALFVASLPVVVYFQPWVVGADVTYRDGANAVVVNDVDPATIRAGDVVVYDADGTLERSRVDAVDATEANERQYSLSTGQHVGTTDVVGRHMMTFPGYGALISMPWQHGFGQYFFAMVAVYLGVVAVELRAAIRFWRTHGPTIARRYDEAIGDQLSVAKAAFAALSVYSVWVLFTVGTGWSLLVAIIALGPSAAMSVLELTDPAPTASGSRD